MEAWVEYDGPGLIYKEVSETSKTTGCQFNGSFEYWAFRGLLAEQLVAPLVTSEALPDFTSIKPPTDVIMAQRWGNNDGRKIMLLNVFAECEAKAETAIVIAMLKSTPGGAEEKQFSARLLKGGACREISNNVASHESVAALRARLALAVYRFTHPAK